MNGLSAQRVPRAKITWGLPMLLPLIVGHASLADSPDVLGAARFANRAFDPAAAFGLSNGFLRTKLGQTANAVASDKTATINLPVGQRYHSVTLIFGYDGSNASKETRGTHANRIVGDIRVKLNGKTQRTFTAKQLNDYNSLHSDPVTGRLVELTAGIGTGNDTLQDCTSSYSEAAVENNFEDVATKINAILRQIIKGQYGLTTSGTMGSSGYREYLTIWFAEPWRKTPSAQAASAWNIHPEDVRSFQIEVDFGTITSPVLDCIYTADALTGRIGFIEKISRQSFTVSGISKDIGDISIPDNDYLRAIHMFAISDGKFVNKAKLTVNGEDVHDLIDYLTQRANLRGFGLNPDLQANASTEFLSPRYDIVVDMDDPIGSVVGPGKAITGMNLRVEFDASASGTLDALIVRDGPPD